MNIVLGVSGGVAAYKACDIVTACKRMGVDVRVVMTKNATELVQPAQFASLSGHSVLLDMWNEAPTGNIDHINAVQGWAHLLLVAPATANVIGKFANGIADDYLSTVFMSADCPKAVAPAMNTVMWESAAVRRNVQRLKDDGVLVIHPGSGRLACGVEGVGKMARVDKIVTMLTLMDTHFAKHGKIDIGEFK